MKLYTVKEAAERSGKTPTAVRAIARRYKGSDRPIGRHVLGRWGFTGRDIERLRGIDPKGGRPFERTVIRHRWGPVIEGKRSCKNCGAVQVLDESGKWSSVPPCK